MRFRPASNRHRQIQDRAVPAAAAHGRRRGGLGSSSSSCSRCWRRRQGGGGAATRSRSLRRQRQQGAPASDLATLPHRRRRNQDEDCRMSASSTRSGHLRDTSAATRTRRRSSSAPTRPGRPASTDVGPSTAGDKTVYIDITSTTSSHPLRGHGGPFAEAYVIAHEYGTTSGLLGTVSEGRQRPPGREVHVRGLELQATATPGVGAHAVQTGFIGT